jgi:helix-turn-helix, Psq domain
LTIKLIFEIIEYSCILKNNCAKTSEIFCDDNELTSPTLAAHKSFETSEEKANKLAAALSDMNNGTLSYSQASRLHCIPKSTLHRHHKRKDIKNHGHQTVLSMEFERELAEYINDFEKHLFAINIMDIRRLAYQMAVHNGIPHPFNNETHMAGPKWIKGFLTRPVGKELAIRRPKCLTMDKLKVFTKENCDQFFDLLNQLAQTHQLDASRIYNIDKTEFSTVPTETVCVASIKRQHRVPKRTLDEHEMDTTVVCCANAAGDWHVKPFIIFRRSEIPQNHAIGPIEGELSYD